MFGLGVSEVLIILVIALVFLGPKKLPELAKGLGKGLRNFQDALKGVEEDIESIPPKHEQKTPAKNIGQEVKIADNEVNKKNSEN